MSKPVTPSSSGEARTPPGAILYAIGDIHGRLDLLTGVTCELRRAAANAPSPARVTAIFLGDYIDRGPDSRGVIDHLMAFAAEAVVETVFLRGNHEQILLDLIDGDEEAAGWLSYGGVETLASYGAPTRMQPGLGEGGKLVELARRVIPGDHAQFLRSTRLFVESGDYLFVHAGVRPDRLLSEQSDSDLLWYRFYADDAPVHGKTVVHGHTPRDRPLVGRWRIGIDTEAWASGALTAVRLQGAQRDFLKFTAGTGRSGIEAPAWEVADQFTDRHKRNPAKVRRARRESGRPAKRRYLIVPAAVAAGLAVATIAGLASRHPDRPVPAPAPIAATPAASTPLAATRAAPTGARSADRPAAKLARIVASAPASADPAATGARVQVGALPTAEAARQAGERARASLAAEAAGKTVKVEPVKTAGGETLYRSLLVGFAGPAEAKTFCRKASAAGLDCLVGKRAG